MRCAASARTRPAFTSRHSRSRICARSNGSRSSHRPGSEPRLTESAMSLAQSQSGPKLLAGSHLESQNFAGWLDGPLGVVYALEAARVINSDPNANGAVEVAAWCDEEGHFGSFLGSRSYVGAVTEDDIDAARDRNSGRTMRDALSEVGLAGRARVKAERGRHIGYLEAHIEQGRRWKAVRSQNRRRHLHRRYLAIPDHLQRRAKSRRHHADGRSQGRRGGAGQVLR